jgi:hypothetical protein
MKRLLMLVGVAAVAAAMYVAASPASQQGSFASQKEVAALKKQVASLSKSLKATKKAANFAASFIADCVVSQNAAVFPVSEFGDGQNGTFGYQYNDGTKPTYSTSALDFDGSSSPAALFLSIDPQCVSTSGLKHGLKLGRSSNRLPLLVPHRP